LFVLLAFTGTWLGHTLEYLRVNGVSGLGRAMSASVHPYMLPLGAALLIVALLGGMAWLRAVTALASRLERLRDALRRGERLEDRSERVALCGPGASMCSLWLLLGVAQLGLYLVQENIEFRLAGIAVPGVGALLGPHWGAAPVHLAVAWALAGLAVVLLSHRLRLEEAVGCHERVLARLWGDRVGPVPALPAWPSALTPHQRWGSQRWQRPPPRALLAA
jgi:hypothetical protein